MINMVQQNFFFILGTVDVLLGTVDVLLGTVDVLLGTVDVLLRDPPYIQRLAKDSKIY